MIVLLVWVFSHCVLKIRFDILEECTATNFRVSESVQLDTQVVVVKQCGCRKVGQSQIQFFFFFEAILGNCNSHCFSVSHIQFSPFRGSHWLQFPQLPFLLSYYISIYLSQFNYPVVEAAHLSKILGHTCVSTQRKTPQK